MARSKSRLLASVLRITSNPRLRRDAATSSASLLGLKRTRLELLYWELPMTSATRRSAQAVLAESNAKSNATRVQHKAATQDEMGLFILNSGCSPSQFFVSILSQNVHARTARHWPAILRGAGRRPVAVTVTRIGLE